MAYIGEIKDDKDLEKAIDRVLSQLKITLLNLGTKKASTLLFWLNDWSERYLPNEDTFNYQSLKYYERGCIVEANFGFKVGSEQGGLHYAIVIENDNDKSNKTVVVVPLGSLDKGQSITELDKHDVFLGYDVFKNETENLEKSIQDDTSKIIELQKAGENVSKIQKRINKNKKKLGKYKLGSVALINQICALSKMRIYTPKYDGDELCNLKLAPEILNDIDEAIKKYYLKK